MADKALPIKHLSARVPWHDNKWDGTVCCDVVDNSFCRILSRIDSEKVTDVEKEFAGESLAKMNCKNWPSCIAEKGTFLSKDEYVRPIEHPFKANNSLFKYFKPAVYHHKSYSFNAVPYLWMIKNKANDEYPHYSEKAETFELDYNVDLEEEIDKKLGFAGNTWVQHEHNQRVLLDAFFGCLTPKKSLIFFYSKHTPLSEPNERVIIGVAKVRTVGNQIEYEFDKGYTGHKSYPWDRCISHTLTAENPDGFLMP